MHSYSFTKLLQEIVHVTTPTYMVLEKNKSNSMASTSYELPSGEYLFLVIIFAFVATVLNCTAAISSRGTVHYMNVAIRGKKTNIITKN